MGGGRVGSVPAVNQQSQRSAIKGIERWKQP